MMIGTERLSFLLGLLHIFSGEMFVQVIFPLIKRIIFNIFDVELLEFTAYSKNGSLNNRLFANTFLYFSGCLFIIMLLLLFISILGSHNPNCQFCSYARAFGIY